MIAPASNTSTISFTGAPVDDQNIVGLGGLEPPTSSLSAKRSNHLSYRPVIAREGYRTGTHVPKPPRESAGGRKLVQIGECDLDATDDIGAEVVDVGTDGGHRGQ